MSVVIFQKVVAYVVLIAEKQSDTNLTLNTFPIWKKGDQGSEHVSMMQVRNSILCYLGHWPKWMKVHIKAIKANGETDYKLVTMCLLLLPSYQPQNGFLK